MKRILLVLLLCSQTVSAQLATYQGEFNAINKDLMLGLGSYAVSNFVLSGIGYATAEDETTKRFHEMNVMWNTVNFGLAVPGYLKAVRDDRSLTLEQMIKAQKTTETVFLVNDVLDVAYIATGVWMRQNAGNHPDRESQLKGYGNSLILQGAFLLAFDAYAYHVHHNHGKSLPALDKVSFGTSGAGVGLVIALD